MHHHPRPHTRTYLVGLTPCMHSSQALAVQVMLAQTCMSSSQHSLIMIIMQSKNRDISKRKVKTVIIIVNSNPGRLDQIQFIQMFYKIDIFVEYIK